MLNVDNQMVTRDFEIPGGWNSSVCIFEQREKIDSDDGKQPSIMATNQKLSLVPSLMLAGGQVYLRHQ